jgi:hypothetical protein
MWDGRRAWAYVGGEAVIDLTGDRIIIRAEKGPEYVAYRQRVDLAAIPGDEIVVEMERWTDLQEKGWFSGDTHVHTPDPAALILEARGEDVHVSSVLVANSGDSWLAFPYFRPGRHPVSDAEHLISYGQEYRHNRLGHVNLLGIQDLRLPEPRLKPPETAAGDWPSLVTLARAVKADGGAVVWGHWPWPCGECPVAVALGLVDAFELLSVGDPMKVREELGESYALLDRTLKETYGRSVYGLSPVDLYYLYLNCGFQIAVSAGSDKYMAWRIVGDARAYVSVEGTLSYKAWMDALRAGRSFATSGPLIHFTVDGYQAGERLELDEPGVVTVRAEAASARPYDRLEIVVDGDVIAEVSAEGERRRASLEEDVDVARTSWIAARCVGEQRLRYGPEGESELPVFAHTSPIYVRVGDTHPRPGPRADMLLEQILYLKDWIRTCASYDSDRQREEALAQAKQAERVLRSVLGKARNR